MVEAKDFNVDEVSEISYYLQSNIRGSILQQLLVLTDNPIDKAKVFVSIYRLINSAKNYISIEELKIKLTLLLKEVESLYLYLYPLIIDYQNTTISFNKHRGLDKIVSTLTELDNIDRLNKFIDIFFLFAEKQQKFDINKITGIDLETDEGKKLFKDAIESSEESNISS